MFDYNARWARAREQMRTLGIDAQVISPSQDIQNMTG